MLPETLEPLKLAISLPSPHSSQRRVLEEASRYNVLACGRRWGKSKLGRLQGTRPALEEGFPVGIYFPTYKMLAEVWRETKASLVDIIAQKSEQEKRIELISGGALEFWSLENPDASRGRKYRRVIIDEAPVAAYLKQAWEEAIRPTLTDYRGDAWFLGSPKGMNYFSNLFNRGRDPYFANWKSWQLPTFRNPFISLDELREAHRDLPLQVFQQEYLAQFLTDGAVFRNVRKCLRAQRRSTPIPGREYYIGVDPAKSHDFLVITILEYDPSSRTLSLIYYDRSNKLDYTFQARKVKRYAQQFYAKVVLVELNAMGEPFLDLLKAEGLSQARGFYTSQVSKSHIVNQLILAFEQESLQIFDDTLLLNEIEAFTLTKTLSGNFTYSASPGMYDDIVMSLCLSLEAYFSRLRLGISGEYSTPDTQLEELEVSVSQLNGTTKNRSKARAARAQRNRLRRS